MDDAERLKSLKTITTAVYALQAAGFLLGLSWIVAVVINYVKRDEAAGTWLESHFRWQIRTFWFGLLGFALGGILMLVLIGWIIWIATGVWLIYRIVKGWIALYENQPLPSGSGPGPQSGA